MFKYNKKLLEHFKNPKNYGKMKNPDGVGREGNPKCGDVMEMYIKVKNGQISDTKFLTFGCVAAIGISSILTEMVRGKTLEEAKKIKPKDILKQVGEIPPVKYHCSVLGLRSLSEAISDYESKKLKKNKE